MKHLEYNKCLNESRKYDYTSEFQLNSPEFYLVIIRNEWDKELLSHMNKTPKSPGYWNYDKCSAIARIFSTKLDFRKYSPDAYSASKKREYLSDICNHMEVLGNKMWRFVYSYTFSDGAIYYGLTCNYTKRCYRHNTETESVVYQYKKKLKEEPIFELLTPTPINVSDAQKMEIDLIDSGNLKGLNVLNRVKGGSIGSASVFWTFEKCKEEALKYKHRSVFKAKSKAYSSAMKNKWLDDICNHMIAPVSSKLIWTFEKCKEEASKYNTLKDFDKNSCVAYRVALNRKWLDDICGHMVRIYKLPNYWTKENCQMEAIKYTTKTDYRNGAMGSYQVAWKNGWLEEICSHMIVVMPRNYWTFEICKSDAIQYKSKSDYLKGSSNSYKAAFRRGWLDEICEHMNKI